MFRLRLVRREDFAGGNAQSFFAKQNLLEHYRPKIVTGSVRYCQAFFKEVSESRRSRFPLSRQFPGLAPFRSEEHTSELQSQFHLVCRLLFFNDTATTEIYTLSLHDALPISRLFLKKSVNRVVPDFHFLDNFRAWRHFPIHHTHARPFELAGCGAFVISGRSEDIGKYYEENREMVFYDDVADLARKIKYYLAHDEEREAIARNAYRRTISEHTYEKRFNEIFSTVLGRNPKS